MTDMEVSGKGVADAKPRGSSRVKFNSSEAGEFKSSEAGAGFELGAVAKDKFGERLARASTIEQGSKVAMPADPIPTWLMSAAPETGEAANSEDLVEEFLQDDDMLSLELICAKWRGLDEFEQEALNKICPQMRKELALGDQHIQEFLGYRRQLNEKHARQKKMQVDRTMRSMESLEENQDDEEAMSESSEETSTLKEAQAVQASKQTGGRSARGSVSVKGAAAAPGAAPAAGSPTGASRRASMAAQPAAAGRLGRAGGAIAGQEDIKQTNPSNRHSSVAAGAKAKAV